MARLPPGGRHEQIRAAAGDKAAGEDLPVALRLLPARYRQHLQAVYGYARAVDDMGDEAPPGQRARLLDDLEADLGQLYRFQGSDPGEPPRLGVVHALAPVVAECGVPQQPFLRPYPGQPAGPDRQPVRHVEQATWSTTASCPPNPVGRIVLYVFGAVSPDRLARRCCPTRCAPRCSASRRHWQDVAEDYRVEARIYLPAEDLARFGVSEADLAAATASAQLREG